LPREAKFRKAAATAVYEEHQRAVWTLTEEIFLRARTRTRRDVPQHQVNARLILVSWWLIT
jgi:hypothetical protein